MHMGQAIDPRPFDALYHGRMRAHGFEPLNVLGHGSHCIAYRARYLGGYASCKIPMFDGDPRTDPSVPFFKRVDHLLNEEFVLNRAQGALGIAGHVTLERRFDVPASALVNLVRHRTLWRTPHILFAMEFIEGRPLNYGEEIVDQQAREMLRICVESLHAHGFANLDLKPENIILPDDGGAYLIDLGYACHADRTDPVFFKSRRNRDLAILDRLLSNRC